MKPVFKCDYCSFMGTEEKVAEHEITCMDNYNRRSCYTCLHRKYKNMNQFECEAGQNIPAGKIYEFCSQYKRKEKSDTPLVDIFGGLFGGKI